MGFFASLRMTRRARRVTFFVNATLEGRHEAHGRPTEGWVFPTGSRSGHLDQGTAKGQHVRAIEASGVKPFEPYCLRHTTLTRLSEDACDAYTLARIAGHSSIVITQRYCHPQADAIQSAFHKMAERQKLVTDGGHRKDSLHSGLDRVLSLSPESSRGVSGTP